MRTFTTRWLPLLVLGIAGYVIFFVSYPQVAPQASVDLQLSRSDAIAQAQQYLEDLQYDLDGFSAVAYLVFDGRTQLYLASRFGMERAAEILRSDSLPGHVWSISFIDPRSTRSQAQDSYTVWLSPAGKVFGFSHAIQDTAHGASLSEGEAIDLATDFLISQDIRLTGYRSDQVTQKRLPNRIDYDFKWTRVDSAMDMDRTIDLRVQGKEVGYFHQDASTRGEFERGWSNVDTAVTFIYSGSVALTFLLFFFIVIFFLKKYHDGEVGVQTAIMVFLILYALAALTNALQYPASGRGFGMGDLNRLNLQLVLFIFSTIIVAVFIQVMVFAGWSVGESYARSGWSAKLTGIDSILHGKFFTVDLASGIVRGYAFGGILIGALAVLGLVSLKDLSGFGVYVPSLHGVPDSLLPALLPITLALWVAAFNDVIYRLFFITYVKEKTRKPWLGVIVSAILFPLTAFIMWDFPFGYTNLEILFPVYAGIGLVFALIFIRYDLLTSATANFTVLALGYALPLFSSGGSYFQNQAWIFAAIMAIPLLVAVIGFVRRQTFAFTPQTLPSHILRITERERMAKELEIARNVQLSLLPKEDPQIEGFDIAGTCIPALEVGGDYYDFVRLSDGKLGIAIGDVSGKGVPAAIYMTLTKGILQSHAEETISPRDALSKVNKLMYRTIDRHSFVSMFYAVLDTRGRTLRFARAGHNPVIFAERSGTGHEFLIPKGIALGLDDGDKFNDTLEERESRLKSGDLLVFYTDGFVEAVRRDGEEFGEERLVASILKSRAASARTILETIVQDVRHFVGDIPQRDDMTMVIVKVN